MTGWPARVAIAALVGTFAFSGGAGGAVGDTDASMGPQCPGGGVQGFAISFARNFPGSASPVAAARYFVRHNVGGYGTASSVWTVARTASEPGAVTVTDGAAFLHTIRLENGRWAVDSGEQCS